jgi:polyisoprenoid-binding protein YceI
MNLFIATSFLAASFLGNPAELKIKSDAVKIQFVGDKETEGTIGGFQASILFDAANLANSTISGTVDVKTLDTGIPKRDEHLKTADFFDVEKYPTMGFKSTSITAEGDAFIMKGLMTIKDVEREETLKFNYADNTFRASSTIQLSYYNVGGYAKKKPAETEVKISFLIPVVQ